VVDLLKATVDNQLGSSRDLLNRTITKVPHNRLDHLKPKVVAQVAHQAMADQVDLDPVALQDSAQVAQEDLLQVACAPAVQVDLLQVCVQADLEVLQALDLPVALVTYSAIHSRSECECHNPWLIDCTG
jgi:hypothetical protein